MKIKVIVATLVVLLCSCTSILLKEDQILLEIHFQEGFRNDLVTASIGGCTFLDNKKITSDEVLGLTRAVFLIQPSKQENFKWLVFNDRRRLKCKIEQLDFNPLQVTFHNEKYTYEIDLEEGDNIGVYVRNGKINFIQDKEPFLYY